MKLLPNFVRSRQIPAPPSGWYNFGYVPLTEGTLGLVRIDRNVATEPLRWDQWPIARLLLSSFNGEIEGEATEVPAVRAPEVDRLADGRWLVVASRANRGEANARIFAPDGSLLNTFEVGDGVQQIACASDGRIWIGYFDEGVYSPANADGSWPPASSGLAAFNATGECQWKFSLDGYHIDDCYALSVSGHTVFACTYSDFPIIKISKSEVRVWKNTAEGAHAIAGRRDHVIIAGGYNANNTRLVLLRLNEDAAIPVAEFHLTDTAGNPPFMRGRDGMIHAIAENNWLLIDIEDWLAAL